MITGYRLVLPTPWERIGLQEDYQARVTAILDRSQERVREQTDAPPDQVAQLRRQIEGNLLSRLRRAKDGGAVDYYLPTDVHRGGMQLNANFLVSMVTPDALLEEEHVGSVMASLIADGDRSPRTVDDTVWLRSEKVLKGSSASEDETTLDHRRVEYVTAMPGNARTWVIVSFTAAGDGDPEGATAHLLVELFDAIMGTWRWSPDPPGADSPTD